MFSPSQAESKAKAPITEDKASQQPEVKQPGLVSVSPSTVVINSITTLSRQATRNEEVDVLLKRLLDKQEPVHAEIKHSFHIVPGPENKSAETITLELIVKSMLQGFPYEVVHDDVLNEVLITCVVGKLTLRFNLNVLLKKANLSHLRFTKEEILAYQWLIRKSKPSLEDNSPKRNELPKPFKSMSQGKLDAIYLYTTDYKYNEFIHGKLVKGDEFALMLLTVCVAGQAISELPVIYSQQVTELFKKIESLAILSNAEFLLFKECITFLQQGGPHSKTVTGLISLLREKSELSKAQLALLDDYINEGLDRLGTLSIKTFLENIFLKLQESLDTEEMKFLRTFVLPKNLERGDTMDWLAYEGTSLVRRAGFMSMRCNSNFSYENIIVDRLPYLPFIISLSAVPGEQETLLPPGQQVLMQKRDGKTYIQLVNTPIAPRMSLAVAMAIREAYVEYLSKPYGSKKPASVNENETKGIVNRSNHALAHTMRKVFYVDSIIHYLSQYAMDEQAREFYQNLLAGNSDVLKIALVFLVTGRESEISFKDNPELYLQYRENSIKHFVKYAEKMGFSRGVIIDLSNLIRNVNNPASKLKQSNQWLCDILSFAHNLDLMRCLGLECYKKEIAVFCSAPMVDVSEQQQKHFNQLLAYATACIKVTGDVLFCQFDTKKGLCDEGGGDPLRFEMASKSPAQCESFLEQVPTPELCGLESTLELDSIKPSPSPLPVAKNIKTGNIPMVESKHDSVSVNSEGENDPIIKFKLKLFFTKPPQINEEPKNIPLEPINNFFKFIL